MIKLLRIGLLALIVTALFSSVSAQGGNLLQNPSFELEATYNVILHSNDEGTVFGVPQGWGGWLTTTPRSETWMNMVPDGYPHTGIFKIAGARSLSITRGFGTFTTAVYQRVAVPVGSNMRGSAQGFMERGSNPTPGAQFRVGIDPTGGTNPLNPAIVWSPWVMSPNGWGRATVEATATGDAVTLFLYSTQSSPTNPNAMYWDDAILEVGGGGGSSGTLTASGTPVVVVPTPAFAPFVQPQGVRPDGSIVHTVVAGDTLDAIAVAYRTTRDEILRLNNMPSRSFLSIGQEIIVSPPGTFPVASPTSLVSSTVVAAATNRATSTPRTISTATQVVAQNTQVVAQNTQAVQPTSTPAAPTNAPATNTSEPTNTIAPTVEASPTDLPPAPVTEVAQIPPSPDVTALCVWMFDDTNKNRIQESTELLLAGGTVEIKQRDQSVQSFQTETGEVCFYDVTPGDYTASGVAPDGYGLTTASVLNIRVQANAKTNVRFGAGEGVSTAVPPTEVAQLATPLPPPVDEQSSSDMLVQMSGLLLVGLAGVVILGGIGLALFIRGR